MFFTHGVSIYNLPEWWTRRTVLIEFQQANGTWAELTLPVLIMAICVLATWVLIRYTTTGRQLYAFGDNPEGARRLGINIAAMHFIAFGWLGMMAGIGGIVQVHYAQEVVPNALVGRELDVLAAVGARRRAPRRRPRHGAGLRAWRVPGFGDPERTEPARHFALRLQDDRRRHDPDRDHAVQRTVEPGSCQCQSAGGDDERSIYQACPKAIGLHGLATSIGADNIGLVLALIGVIAIFSLLSRDF